MTRPIPIVAALLVSCVSACEETRLERLPVTASPAPSPSAAVSPSPSPSPVPTPDPPSLSITSGPSGFVAATTASFEFSGGASAARFECQRDAHPIETCTSPKSYAGVGGGVHVFRVTAFDALGRSVAETRSWTVDLLGPTVELTARPPSPTAETSARFEFRSTDQSGIAEYQCRADGAAFQTCTSPMTLSGVAAGSHGFDVRARDGAGNWGASTSHSWQVAAPVPTYDQSFVLSSRTITGVNGWFPQLSADARYLLSGFGDVYGTDLVTGASVHLMARAYHPYWIRPGVGTFVREDNPNGTLATRFEVGASSWSAVAQPGDPSLVAGSLFRASDGSWATWIAGLGRLVYNGSVLMASGAGGALQVSENAIAHALIAGGEYRGIRHWVNGNVLRDYPTRTPQEAHEIALARGYIAYGGYGPI
ncbi:MAG TPA: hypothetical protein VM598_10435, partial [Bdellovibrionota bacterium]|nr:hypothetical protein [Bdellovibrionota bacterium]